MAVQLNKYHSTNCQPIETILDQAIESARDYKGKRSDGIGYIKGLIENDVSS